MRRVAALLLLAAGCLAGAGAHAQTKGGYRGFESWAVGCDNLRTCRLYGFVAEDGTNEPVLVIHREGAGAKLPVVEILWPDASPDGELVLAADGQALGTLRTGAGLEAPSVAGRGHRVTAEPVAQGMLASLRKAAELTISVAGAKEPHRIKLKGASAALLYMDEFQQRLGTRTALVRQGEKPADAVPPPPRLPVPPKAVRGAGKLNDDKAPPALARLYREEADKACDLDEQEADKSNVLIAHRLAPGVVLYGMQCWRAAYNFGTAFYLVARGGVSRAVFPQAYDSGRKTESGWPAHVLTNADFDEATLTVSFFHKGRGPSDCGESGAWRWDGRAFVPVSAYIMPWCRSLMSESWLTLYRSQGADGAPN